ncbi:MAG: DUF86 domain-containing protein [Methanomicrobiales archaeon]|nr:DUF86 domain-containing protein [Methanomicrobiales archaeon]
MPIHSAQEVKSIPPDRAIRPQQMARFRNLLIHRYWKVEDERIHCTIKGDMGDLKKFLEVSLPYLEGE